MWAFCRSYCPTKRRTVSLSDAVTVMLSASVCWMMVIRTLMFFYGNLVLNSWSRHMKGNGPFRGWQTWRKHIKSSVPNVGSRSLCLPSFISQSVKKSDQFDLDLRPAWNALAAERDVADLICWLSKSDILGLYLCFEGVGHGKGFRGPNVPNVPLTYQMCR